MEIANFFGVPQPDLVFYRETPDGRVVPSNMRDAFEGRWKIRKTWFDLWTWLREPFGSRLHDVTVSTVFLGIDHRFSGKGAPILWETMIFGGEHDEYQARYDSRAKAIEGHEAALAMVRSRA